MSRLVTIINQATGIIDDTTLLNFIADTNTFLAGVFADTWSISAGITNTGGGYHLYLVPVPTDADPHNALGYHDLTVRFEPYARVFVQTSLDNGIAWQTVASHEAFEMLVDPLLQSQTFLDSGNGYSGWIVYDEIADPVERQYMIGPQGSAISNFVLPGWYLPGYTGKVDAMGLLPGPLRIASGGYASADYVEYGTGWQTFTGFKRSPGRPRLQKIKKEKP